jgi:hypothetical protein
MTKPASVSFISVPSCAGDSVAISGSAIKPVHATRLPIIAGLLLALFVSGH